LFLWHLVYVSLWLFRRPFYRTEMLIITARNNSQWRHHTDFDDRLYGPVLRKDILDEVQFTLYELFCFYLLCISNSHVLITFISLICCHVSLLFLLNFVSSTAKLS